jgi:hypothetical protein
MVEWAFQIPIEMLVAFLFTDRTLEQFVSVTLLLAGDGWLVGSLQPIAAKGAKRESKLPSRDSWLPFPTNDRIRVSGDDDVADGVEGVSKRRDDDDITACGVEVGVVQRGCTTDVSLDDVEIGVTVVQDADGVSV